jgi:hypothetical protein
MMSVETVSWLLVAFVLVASSVTIYVAANKVDEWCDDGEKADGADE